MNDLSRSPYFLCSTRLSSKSSSVDFGQKGDRSNPTEIREARRFSVSAGPGGKPQNVSFPTTRCTEKGCVFPASPNGRGKCSYHLHEQEEPKLFRSHQPTGLLLNSTRTLSAEKEYNGSRKRDRRRMAEIWEQFQSEGTP